MTDDSPVSNATETRARFVNASEARQSSALVGKSGWPRRFGEAEVYPERLQGSRRAPRNDGDVLLSMLMLKGAMQ